MEINKELFNKINDVAQKNIDKATGMLDMVNEMFGTKYFFINKRVCYETFDHGVRAFHDAWILAE